MSNAGPLVCVVGAGTEIGKTHVSTALLACVRSRGLRCRGLKPIESGAGAMASDAVRLGEAAGRVVAPRYAFDAALSPHLAARRCGVVIELSQVAAWVSTERRGLTVVETAGGLLSPLDDSGQSNLDLCVALDPDAVVAVAKNELGTLHQVASLMLALSSSGLRERTTVVLNQFHDGPAQTSNREELLRLGLADRVVVLGPDPEPGAASLFEALALSPAGA